MRRGVRCAPIRQRARSTTSTTLRSSASASSQAVSAGQWRNRLSCATSMTSTPLRRSATSSRVLDQPLHDGARAFRDLVAPRHAPHRHAALGIDAREPRNEGRAHGGELRLLGGRDRGRAAGLCERARDRGLDRALHAADLLIVGKRQLAVAAKVGVEALKREGQQRQRIGALRVGDELLGQGRVDCKPPARIPQRAARVLRSRS